MYGATRTGRGAFAERYEPIARVGEPRSDIVEFAFRDTDLDFVPFPPKCGNARAHVAQGVFRGAHLGDFDEDGNRPRTEEFRDLRDDHVSGVVVDRPVQRHARRDRGARLAPRIRPVVRIASHRNDQL